MSLFNLTMLHSEHTSPIILAIFWAALESSCLGVLLKTLVWLPQVVNQYDTLTFMLILTLGNKQKKRDSRTSEWGRWGHWLFLKVYSSVGWYWAAVATPLLIISQTGLWELRGKNDRVFLKWKKTTSREINGNVTNF